MAYDSLSRISVCVLDEGGLLQVRGGEGQYRGVLPRVPKALSIGDTAHVRLSMTKGGSSDDETLDLLGTIFLLEGGPGPVAVKDGLIFEVDVSHMSRRAMTDARVPLTRSAGITSAAEASEVPNEDTLQASPLAPHPALQMLNEGPSAAEALEAATLDDASLEQASLDDASLDDASLDEQDADDDDDAVEIESPIHFGVLPRVVDVERREADADVAAALLFGPAPVSAIEGAPVEDDVVADAAYAADGADVGFPPEEVTAQERGLRGSRGGVLEATEPSGVFGTLRELALTEVVQSLGFSGKTAQIEVRPKGSDVPPGVVFLEKGHVVHARCGALEGDEAFFVLAEQRRGAFLIRFHVKAPTRNVDQPTAYLMLEALRRMDEENHERDLVERVAEELAAADASHDEEPGDRTMQSSLPRAEGEAASKEEPGITEPFARIPARPREVTRLDRPTPAADAAMARDANDSDEESEHGRADLEYELDDDAVEEALVAVEELGASDDDSEEEGRPYATALPTTVFARFFEEASEELPPPPATGDSDDVSDPTFTGLKAALKGLKAHDEDTLAAFDRPVSTGSFPSYS